MKITLVGSCRFENEYKFWNELLTLRGHIVYSVAVLPSDKEGLKTWYMDEQKKFLDLVHLKKISESDAILVITRDRFYFSEASKNNPYIGESTAYEILWAKMNNKLVLFDYAVGDDLDRQMPEGEGEI